jgi:predicted aspartyl protease
VSLPFDPAGGQIVVPAFLMGPGGRFGARLVLDTGATITMVSQSILATLGYDPDAAPRRRPVSTASGIVFAPYVTLDRLTALGQERPNFPILAHTLPSESSVDGVLGLDFLRGTRLLLDFRLGVLLLD